MTATDRPVYVQTEDSIDASDNLESGGEILLGDFHVNAGEPVPDRTRVEPFLAALLQIEHLNLLLGAGLTKALTGIIGFKDDVNMGAKIRVEDNNLTKVIEDAAARSAASVGRGQPNIEDRLRVALTAADGLRYVGDNRAEHLHRAVKEAISALRDSISRTEQALYAKQNSISQTEDQRLLQHLLISFLASFAGRTPTRDRLHIFTTNYDRVIEWGADLAGLRIVDRFVGSLQPMFRSSRLDIDYHYSPPGAARDPRYLDGVFRFTKLHGSLDWRADATSHRVIRIALPFGGTGSSSTDDLLIYPQASKDIETTLYPYVDLFRDFSGAICRPHSALVTYGYSFGDDHINRIVKDMLTIPSTYLLIISYDDQAERIKKFVSDHRRTGQIGLMIGRSVADLQTIVEQWLPHPSAEFLVQKQAGIVRGRSLAEGTRTTSEHKHDFNG